MIILSVVFPMLRFGSYLSLEMNGGYGLWIFLSVLSLIGVALAPVLKQLFNKYTPIKDKSLKEKYRKTIKTLWF